MSTCSRRSFLKRSAGFAAAAGIGLGAGGCPKKEPTAAGRGVKWRYAMCNESMRELPWAEQCKIVGEAGYQGVEIAAFTLVKEGVGEITPAQRKEMVAAMDDAGIVCTGLHWLLTPPPAGLHFTTPDKTVRDTTVAYLRDLIDFCGDLGGTAMIFGSPKQRSTAGISVDEAKKYFAEGLAAVADQAQGRGVVIMIEPLDKSQTDVVNVTSEAVEMVKQINHPAIQTMFDFHNTVDETEPFDVVIRTYYPNIRHVHVQEMDGKYLGTGDGRTAFVKAFQTLKELEYDKWVSLEVFDFSPGGRTIAVESMKVLREIESKLT
ncbi:MAG TPA: sugar phosphate isomerase/epimerase family protein [Anaerohalosphaeraceae bacterium]|jgi:D-psicose/D-tagatose/L-ribulose 3-epimerase|nr:sugar phosphate isomerase/epimerase family protein [Anaerohalosphaeraceae bacterium]HRT51128.1 sugar phosphate isomerase/epimerase family protein [Anaerohalosphaeraceae bacterium]HRT87143.1 sugar phosphate isomerase/epimerase family protein [Anaerohalosphaeraceae bacterium]